MRRAVPFLIAYMALDWPMASMAAPQKVVPPGASFPVQRYLTTLARTGVDDAGGPPAAVPAGSTFPSASIVGLPVVVRLDAPRSGLTDEGNEVLRWVLGSDVLFDFDKADLRPEGERELKSFIEKLVELDDFTLTIEGHTDSKGTVGYNQDLSQRRANAVAAWLMGALPDLPNPNIVAFGETRPAVANEKRDGSDDPAGRQLNRRVEIVVRSAASEG